MRCCLLHCWKIAKKDFVKIKMIKSS
jgi:hypothetical protein